MMEKYDQIFAIEEISGKELPQKTYIDVILKSKGRGMKGNNLLTNKSGKPVNLKKLHRRISFQEQIDKYEKVFTKLRQVGISVNAPADFVDTVLEGVKGGLIRKGA